VVDNYDRKVKSTGNIRKTFVRKNVDTNKIKVQYNGFVDCLSIWFLKTFPTFKGRVVNRIPIPKDLPLVDYPKYFKYNLCYNFSKYQSQEMPEGDISWRFDILSVLTKEAKLRVKTLLTSTKKKTKRNVFLWNLLQCKVNAAKVPQEFILAGYQKHAKQMSLPAPPISENLRNEIQEFIKPYISLVKRNYSSKTKFPSNHATSCTKRSDGGLRSSLVGNLVPDSYLSPVRDRTEPVVIHLEGPPGSGKSRLVRKLCQRIGARFGLIGEISAFTYYRSAAAKHWDGYRGQLITVIDDVGFQASKSGAPSDVAELIQLVSECDVVLPMAKLHEKGQLFRSHFLILTSNCLRKQGCHTHWFTEPAALSRRISPTTYMYPDGKMESFTFTGNDNSNFPRWEKLGSRSTSQIVEESIQKFLLLHQEEGKRDVVQTIVEPSLEGPGLAIRWNAHHKYTLDDNYVVACAIAEPLKVRMITKPSKYTYALKPLQLAMFKSLQKWKCFEPCWNPSYDLSQLGPLDSKKVLLSGDYTAATDELNFNVSQIVIDELCKVFKDDEFIHSLIKWEGKQHIVSYPEWTRIPDTLQANGQLMGSLLSFPILCIVNAFTMCKATNTSLDDVPAVFHGDDIAAQVTEQQIDLWKSVAAEVGLQLSVGKNYVAKEFISIDSQLFCKKDQQLVKEVTGKFKLLKNDDINCIPEALSQGFTKDIVRKFQHTKLSKSIRSIDVPKNLGGLGANGTPSRPMTLQDKVIYFTMFQGKSKVKQLSDGIVQLPKEVARFLSLGSAQLIPEEHEISEFQLNCKVKKNIYRYNKDKSFQILIDRIDESSRPLDALKSEIVYCKNFTVHDLQSFSDSLGSFGKHRLIKSNKKIDDGAIHRLSLSLRQKTKPKSRLCD